MLAYAMFRCTQHNSLFFRRCKGGACGSLFLMMTSFSKIASPFRFAMTITPMYSYWLNVYDYIPDTNTKIRTTGAINFSKILNAYPKNVSPKLSFQKFFMHQPAIKHINNVLNGNNIFDVV